MYLTTSKKILSLCLFALSFAVIIAVPCAAMAIKNSKEPTSITVDIPENWDKDYTEYASADYIEFDQTNWDTYVPDTSEEFTTVTLNETVVGASFTSVANIRPTVASRTLSDVEVAQLNEQEAWEYISNGIYTDYVRGSLSENKSKLLQIQMTNTEVVTIDCWYWEDPSDETNFNKITVQKKFAVNSKIADSFRHIFEDIYNHPDRPVINIADGGMGTWVIRSKTNSKYGSPSAHALGCAVDLNPSTGSFYVNGKWYGNAYGQNTMSQQIWEQLPECHKKYHVLYDGSPIVEIFKSYGWYWGGDWSSTKDCMHLAYVGDGNGRARGVANYNERN